MGYFIAEKQVFSPAALRLIHVARGIPSKLRSFHVNGTFIAPVHRAVRGRPSFFREKRVEPALPFFFLSPPAVSLYEPGNRVPSFSRSRSLSPNELQSGCQRGGYTEVFQEGPLTLWQGHRDLTRKQTFHLSSNTRVHQLDAYFCARLSATSRLQVNMQQPPPAPAVLQKVIGSVPLPVGSARSPSPYFCSQTCLSLLVFWSRTGRMTLG